MLHVNQALVPCLVNPYHVSKTLLQYGTHTNYTLCTCNGWA